MSAKARKHLKNQEYFDIDEIFDDKSLVNAIGAILQSYHRQQMQEKLGKGKLIGFLREQQRLGNVRFFVNDFTFEEWLLNHLKETNKG